MKKIIIAILLSVASLPSFAQAGKVFNIDIKEFARDRNMVNVEFTVDVDDLRTTEMWTLTPVIRSGSTSKQLTPIVIAGTNKRRMLDRANRLRGVPYPADLHVVRRNETAVAKYRTSVPYEDWMRNSSLVLEENLSACSRTFAFTENIGNIYAAEIPQPYVIVPSIIFVIPRQEEVKERNIVATAFIDFPINRSEIQRNFRRNPQELDMIKSTIKQVQDHSDMTFTGIFLHGFASPDGPYANNERLARERVQALKNHIVKNFGISAGAITTKYTAEDWDGLRKLVENSFIESRDQILAIIDGNDAPDTKEANIRKLNDGQPWRIILSEMMPGLRRTDYRIDFTVREYDVADAREVLETNPELLSHYELDKLAKEYGEDSPQYTRIYAIIERQFPTDDDANLNVAAFKIRRGDYAGAAVNLERVTNRTAAYYNNIGIVLMMTGRFAEAQAAFRQAGDLREARRNLEEVEKYLEVQKEIESYR